MKDTYLIEKKSYRILIEKNERLKNSNIDLRKSLDEEKKLSNRFYIHRHFLMLYGLGLTLYMIIHHVLEYAENLQNLLP